ncbi:hypothetical protein GCM10010222_11890 [Streptomyces tanashiensis]|nr:hypothetical protein GCM10010222_11890 [Streptomyces tanashiensis]
MYVAPVGAFRYRTWSMIPSASAGHPRGSSHPNHRPAAPRTRGDGPAHTQQPPAIDACSLLDGPYDVPGDDMPVYCSPHARGRTSASPNPELDPRVAAECPELIQPKS